MTEARVERAAPDRAIAGTIVLPDDVLVVGYALAPERVAARLHEARDPNRSCTLSAQELCALLAAAHEVVRRGHHVVSAPAAAWCAHHLSTAIAGLPATGRVCVYRHDPKRDGDEPMLPR